MCVCVLGGWVTIRMEENCFKGREQIASLLSVEQTGENSGHSARKKLYRPDALQQHCVATVFYITSQLCVMSQSL